MVLSLTTAVADGAIEGFKVGAGEIDTLTLEGEGEGETVPCEALGTFV